MKSASYYGWRDFQDGIAAIHAAMTTEERRSAGIHAETVEPGRSTLSNKAVIRHRDGSTTAYIFADETLVDAIRGASRLENNFLLEGAGKLALDKGAQGRAQLAGVRDARRADQFALRRARVLCVAVRVRLLVAHGEAQHRGAVAKDRGGKAELV